MHIYIYTHQQSQNGPTKIKYSRLTQQTKEIKNFIYQLRTKLTKGQTRKHTKARCQVGNKAMKAKTNKYVERKGRKEKKEQICKVR